MPTENMPTNYSEKYSCFYLVIKTPLEFEFIQNLICFQNGFSCIYMYFETCTKCKLSNIKIVIDRLNFDSVESI